MHRHTGFKAEHLQSGELTWMVMDTVLIEERWWYGLWSVDDSDETVFTSAASDNYHVAV